MKLVSSAGRFPLVAVALPAMGESVRACSRFGFARERCVVVAASAGGSEPLEAVEEQVWPEVELKSMRWQFLSL
jgi:hypothetical protein